MLELVNVTDTKIVAAGVKFWPNKAVAITPETAALLEAKFPGMIGKTLVNPAAPSPEAEKKSEPDAPVKPAAVETGRPAEAKNDSRRR